MYPAIFSRTYSLPQTADVLDAIKGDGFEGLQANLSSAGLASLPGTLPPRVAACFGLAARTRGLRLAALSGTYNMAHPDRAARIAARPGFKNVLMAAHDMGVPIVTLCTGSRDAHDMWRYHPDNQSEAAHQDLHAELAFALDRAQQAGIVLAIEPEPANIVRDARAAAKVLREMAASNLGVILDAANLLTPATLPQQYSVMAEAVDLLGDCLLLAHAKDIDPAGRVVAPGEGAVDLAAFTRMLRAAGYDGALIAHGFAREKASAAAQTLRRLIGEPV